MFCGYLFAFPGESSSTLSFFSNTACQGFGIAMGADVYSRTTGLSVVGPDDYRCGSTHQADGPWWQRTVPIRWGEFPSCSLVPTH